MWYSKLCDFSFSVFDSFCAGFLCFRWWRNMERCMDRHVSVSCWVWIKLLWISAQRLRRARDLYKRLPCELQPRLPYLPYLFHQPNPLLFSKTAQSVHLQRLNKNISVCARWWQQRSIRKNKSFWCFHSFRLNTIDVKYQIWKLGVVFTDNVRSLTLWTLNMLYLKELVKSEIKLCFSFSQSFLYLAWYMFVSVLGHYNNFFFAAHLLDIVMGFKTLRTILSSVTHNGKQVLHLVYVCVYTKTPKCI